MIDILSNPIFFILAGYVVLMVATLYAIQPARLKIASLVAEMLAEDRWDDEQVQHLKNLAYHSLSFMGGTLLPFSLVSITLDDILRRQHVVSPSMRELDADPRMAKISRLFFLSLAAANPFAAIVSIPLLMFSLLIGIVTHNRPARLVFDETMEESVFRTLGRSFAAA